MHIHPPKPLHGWKEFLNEIFVIVVGVLIALGLEQVVEELHWQHKVNEGEERLKPELEFNFKAAIYLITTAPCKNAELDVLENRVINSGATLEPAPLEPISGYNAFIGGPGRVFYGGNSGMGSDVWQALNADGTAIHMPIREQRRLGEMYHMADTYMAGNKAIPSLVQLARPIPLDPAVREALITRIEDTRQAKSRQADAAIQIAATIRDIGYKPDDSTVERYLRADVVKTIARCRKEGHPLVDWHKALDAMPDIDKEGF